MRWSWLPNGLCVLRMLLSIPTAWLLLQGAYWWTMAVFFIAAVTDALDGFLAKRQGWETELGKILDPLADKLLLMTTFITLALLHAVPVWLAVLVVMRDLVISFGAIAYRLWLGPIGGSPTLISKLNTLAQIAFVLGVVLVQAMRWENDSMLRIAGWMIAITTFISGIDYVVTYSRRAADARDAQREAHG
jgi:cardiolipin synthase